MSTTREDELQELADRDKPEDILYRHYFHAGNNYDSFDAYCRLLEDRDWYHITRAEFEGYLVWDDVENDDELEVLIAHFDKLDKEREAAI